MSNFFRLDEEEEFRFYRLPKALFLDDEYKDLSADAKLLYGVLYDRMELSRLNKWTDEYGRVFIYFTIREAAKLLGFGREKTGKLFTELESQDLILRIRQGRGIADIIYPKKIHGGKTDFLMTEKQASRNREIRFQEVGKSGTNDTEENDTDSIETNLSSDVMEQKIRAQIEYDVLCSREPSDRIDELVSIIGQVYSIRSPTMKICGCEYDIEYVKSRFQRLKAEHIEYVLDCMDANISKIKNMSAYLIAALFNAPATIDSYYRSEVNHDMDAWCNT